MKKILSQMAPWIAPTYFFVGCGTIDYALRNQISNEAKNLAPPVESTDEVKQWALNRLERSTSQFSEISIPQQAELEDFVLIALDRNPAIRRVVRKLQASGFRVEQVTSLEDPMFNLIPPTNDMVETAAGMMDASLGISQMIPFPGKLMQRGAIAEQEVRMAFAELADIRIQIASDVARAYQDYYLANTSKQITKESQALLEQIRAVAAVRYQAGNATQQDVLRAEVESYSLINDQLTFQQLENSAKAKLNTLMNRVVDAELPAPRAPALEEIDWKLPTLLAKGLQSNPKLAKLEEQLKRDLEAVKLARLEYFPNFRVGFSYSIIGSGISPVATGDDNWNIPLGLNLPIWWQKIRAGINEANANVLRSGEELDEMRNLVFWGIQDTLIKIDTEYRQAVLFKDLIIPRSLQAVEVATASYQAGDVEFTSLIENWRNWLKFSLAFQRSLAGLEQRFADLQQLIGIQMPRKESGDPMESETPTDLHNNSADVPNIEDRK